MTSVNEGDLQEYQQQLCDSVAKLLPHVPLHVTCTVVMEQLAHFAEQVTFYHFTSMS